MENKKDYYVLPNGKTTFEFIKEYLEKGNNGIYNGAIPFTPFDGFLIGNIIKYLARNGKKENAHDDLEKAKHYAEIYCEDCIPDFPDADDFHKKVIKYLLSGDLLQAQANFNELIKG